MPDKEKKLIDKLTNDIVLRGNVSQLRYGEMWKTKQPVLYLNLINSLNTNNKNITIKCVVYDDKAKAMSKVLKNGDEITIVGELILEGNNLTVLVKGWKTPEQENKIEIEEVEEPEYTSEIGCYISDEEIYGEEE